MCGLTGFWQPEGGFEPEMRALVRRMADTLVHRGPDDDGVWVEARDGVAFGFRRLAVIDVTPTGHQPMVSANGRYVIVFNGEIYNHRELRAELLRHGIEFRGASDTEVILESLSFWGVEGTVPRLWGMFAMAIWDRHEKTLIFARDRLGKKPLYYTDAAGTVVFGSELKALRAHPLFKRDIDRSALAAYLRFGYVPAPLSIYQNVKKLLPGTYAVIRENASAEMHTYWSAEKVAREGTSNHAFLSEEDAAAELERLLKDAVARRMISDVPLGALLSGGIDSSTIVGLMQCLSSRPVKTFTIGFDVPEYNEALSAKAIARHLGTEHTELYASPADALAVIPRIPDLYDEPFADSSQIPTYLVCALARQHVTVSLSGDGGDEVFGGYIRYTVAGSIAEMLRYLPMPMRKKIAGTIRAVPVSTWNRWVGKARPVLPKRWRVHLPGDKIYKLSELLSAREADEIYAQLVSYWKDPTDLAIGVQQYPELPLKNPASGERNLDFTQRMMLLDLMTYLPDDILVKVDRASMAVSLEARAPLLDHRLVEWAWKLPMKLKIRNGRGKYLLRKVLSRYIPDSLMERPKTGFGIPLGEWLRGPLREWAEAQLSDNRLRREQFLNPMPIRASWSAHLRGDQNEQYRLWAVLMFQAWLEKWSQPIH